MCPSRKTSQTGQSELAFARSNASWSDDARTSFFFITRPPGFATLLILYSFITAPKQPQTSAVLRLAIYQFPQCPQWVESRTPGWSKAIYKPITHMRERLFVIDSLAMFIEWLFTDSR